MTSHINNINVEISTIDSFKTRYNDEKQINSNGSDIISGKQKQTNVIFNGNTIVKELNKDVNLKEDVEENFMDGLKNSFSVIYPVFILDFFFYLFLNSLNTNIISKINFTFNSLEIIDAIGFTNTILHLSLLPLYYGFGNILAILGSQAFGGGKLGLLNFVVNQTRLFGYIFSFGICVVVICVYSQLCYLFGLNEEITRLSYYYTISRMISFIFEYEIYILLIYLQIIDKGFIGLLFVLAMFPIFPFFSDLFITQMKLGELGVAGAGLTYALTNLTLMIFLKIYMLYLDEPEKEKEKNSKEETPNELDFSKNLLITHETFNNLNEKNESKQNKDKSNVLNIYKSITNTLSTINYHFYSKNEKTLGSIVCGNSTSNKLVKYLENKKQYILTIFQSYPIYFQYSNLITISFFDIMSAEMISTMAIFLPSKDYTSYVVTSTIYGLVQCVNMAFSVCANVNIGYFIGKGDHKKGKRYFYYILINTNTIMLIVCSLAYYFQKEILSLISEPGDIIDETAKLYSFTLIINMQDSTFAILLNTLKTLNENELALKIMIIYNIINGILMYIFAFVYSYSVKGLFYGYICSDLLVLCGLIYVFNKKIDWISQTKNTLNFLDMNDKVISKLEEQVIVK